MVSGLRVEPLNGEVKLLREKGKRIRGQRRGQPGFTVGELAIVVFIIGLLAIVAPLELRPTNNVTTMKSAVTQVGRVLKDAYSIAQQEKVQVVVSFYASDDATEAKRNSYEVFRGATNEPMHPPIGVKFTTADVSGVTHYYCKLLDGGPQPTIPTAVTVYFKPMGASTMCVDAAGTPTNYTITLAHSSLASRTVTVNEEGEVYP